MPPAGAILASRLERRRDRAVDRHVDTGILAVDEPRTATQFINAHMSGLATWRNSERRSSLEPMADGARIR